MKYIFERQLEDRCHFFKVIVYWPLSHQWGSARMTIRIRMSYGLDFIISRRTRRQASLGLFLWVVQPPTYSKQVTINFKLQFSYLKKNLDVTESRVFWYTLRYIHYAIHCL